MSITHEDTREIAFLQRILDAVKNISIRLRKSDEDTQRKLDLLLRRETRRRAVRMFVVPISLGGHGNSVVLTQKGSSMDPVTYTLPDDKILRLSVVGEDSKGNVAPLENATFTSSDPTIATVDATGVVTPIALGTVQITAQADAKIGDGEDLLTALGNVTVVAGEAVSLSLQGSIEAPPTA